MTTTTPPKEHPAKFSKPIIHAIQGILEQEVPRWRKPVEILDPMAGVGGIHALASPGLITTTGVEIEPEWAGQHPATIVGDSTALPGAWRHRFPIVAFSPPYGNRMSDAFVSKDGTRRITYYHMLGRTLDDNSVAKYHYGPEYQKLMIEIYKNCKRVLKRKGLLIVNLSNFIQAGEEVDIVSWHVDTCLYFGFDVAYHVPIETRRMRFGANRQLRVSHEHVYGFRAP